MIHRIAMTVRVFMQRLRVGDISEEGIEAIESSDFGIVVSRAEIVPAEFMVEEFAAKEVLRECLRWIEADGIAVGVVVVALHRRAGQIGKCSRVTESVMHEEVRLRGVWLCSDGRFLADALVAEGMAVCS